MCESCCCDGNVEERSVCVATLLQKGDRMWVCCLVVVAGTTKKTVTGRESGELLHEADTAVKADQMPS